MVKLRLHTAILLVLFVAQLHAQKTVTDPEPRLLTWSQQLAMRERYGMTLFGQSCLAARRLVDEEAKRKQTSPLDGAMSGGSPLGAAAPASVVVCRKLRRVNLWWACIGSSIHDCRAWHRYQAGRRGFLF
jgi:acyl-coenzyme A synthetase/AMP-(fatty) acid ligase